MPARLSEHTMKDICKCEGCGKEPLSHLEECPICYSEAYHITIKSYEEEEENG